MDSIKLVVPATSANLGSGFDICGIALARPTDTMWVSKADYDKIDSVGTYDVPTSLEANTCGPVIRAMRDRFGIGGVRMAINKGIKPGSGMGSSAATAAGTAFAIDKLYRLSLEKEELAQYASLGEAVSAGTPHADNVTPAIFGGFTIITSREPLRVKRIKAPPSLEAIIILPRSGKASTKAAREALPASVPREAHQRNMQLLASLICSFEDGDIDGIIASMDDAVAEPARHAAGILPHLYEVREAGRELGYGVVASGAGPSILALGKRSPRSREALVARVKDIFRESHEIITSGISNQGARKVG